MNISDRIQALRKSKGLSQEALADKLGVSRQAVSKWESEQCAPDLDKIIIMSDFFGVTTDYILKGIESPCELPAKSSNDLTCRILYIGSVAFILIGLLCAVGGWYEERSAESIWGSAIIQVIGVAGYAIGRLLSGASAPLTVKLFNICIAIFMPLSLLVTALLKLPVAPYPTDAVSCTVFAIAYAIICGIVFAVLKTAEHYKSKKR